MDEVFCFRGRQKLSCSRAGDEDGQVIEVLLRDKWDRASAEAFFRHALARTDVTPTAVIPDHHQPYGKAVATVIPFARHVRTGFQRPHGYTTQPVERSHVPTRDRLRGVRGLRTISSGQQLLESFEALPAFRRGRGKLRALVPTYRPTQSTEHAKVRVVIVAMAV